jgi:hypothetical protein
MSVLYAVGMLVVYLQAKLQTHFKVAVTNEGMPRSLSDM